MVILILAASVGIGCLAGCLVLFRLRRKIAGLRDSAVARRSGCRQAFVPVAVGLAVTVIAAIVLVGVLVGAGAFFLWRSPKISALCGYDSAAPAIGLLGVPVATGARVFHCTFTNVGGPGAACATVSVVNVDGARFRAAMPICSGDLGRGETKTVTMGAAPPPAPTFDEICNRTWTEDRWIDDPPVKGRRRGRRRYEPGKSGPERRCEIDIELDAP
jgi:hypothetical protein